MTASRFQANRRRLAAWAGLSAALAATGASAQTTAPWPNRPVRLVVGMAAGGLADILARVIQTPLSQALGQPVVIDNRGGAGGNVAGAEVVNNGGDGHSFLITPTTTESVNPTLFSKMPFDPQRDLVPVGLLANSHLFLFMRPTLPPESLKAFIAYAKAHPETLSYGSAGNGTTPHLAGELLKQNGGITAAHLPYRGAMPAILDVMAGQIDFAFGPATVFQYVKAGKLKVLAVASRNRSPIAPDVPTLAELGIDGVFADSMFGIYAPKATPPAVVERFNRALNEILAQPAIKARFVEAGAEALPLAPADYKALVQSEQQLFSAIVKARGITAE